MDDMGRQLRAGPSPQAESCLQGIYDSQSADPVWPVPPQPVDRPAGQFAVVTSGVTGKPMRYFIPDPLKDLLSRCAIRPRRLHDDFNDPRLGLVLAGEAARRLPEGVVDIPQARRFCEEMSGTHGRYASVKDLIDIRKEIGSKDSEIRQEIVFSGGRTASQAQHVFAPHAAIPEMLEMLVEAIVTQPPNPDAGVVTAVTGLYAVLVHPFRDGNGRWSRLLAARAGMGVGPALRVMANIVFLSHCKDELVERIWPSACHSGLREYIWASLRFEEALLDGLFNRDVLNDANALNAEIARASKNRRDLERVLFQIYAMGEIALEALKRELGLSQRVLQGLTIRIEEKTESRVLVRGGMLRLQGMQEQTAAAIQNARQQVV